MGPWELVGALADIAEDQRGFFTTAQAGALGIDDAVLAGMARARALEPSRTDVWRMRGFDDMETYDDVYAWWLALRPELAAAKRTVTNSPVLSHFGAARMYGYFGMPANICTVTPGVTLSPARQEGVCYEKSLAENTTIQWKNALVTSPERTALDLVEADTDLETFGHVVEKLVRTGLASPESLAHEIDAWAKEHGAGSGADHVGAALLVIKPGARW